MLLKTSIQKKIKNFNFMVKSEIFAIEKIIKNFPNPKLGIGKFFNYFYDQGVSSHEEGIRKWVFVGGQRFGKF